MADEVVCPKVELLTEIETNIVCTAPGCSKILPNTSCLRMHLVKTHNITRDTQESDVFEHCQNKSKKKTLYCCPVDTCVRGKKSGRTFNRLAHVKQHYMTVHAEKKFACKVCEKKFGRNDACLRHEKTCGQIFTCTCGCPFKSRTSMLTHARRNGHTIPPDENQTIDNSHGRGSNTVCISIVPSVQKYLHRPLKPKVLLVNTETQTDESCLCKNQNIATQPLVSNCIMEASYEQKMDEAFTQTMLNEAVEEVYTQTVDGAFSQPFGEAFTQTVEGVCRQTMDEAYTQTMTDIAFTIDNDDLKELAHSQTQTSLELALRDFPLFEDNQTQTLESYLEFDPTNITSDSATQTKFLDDIFSVGTQTLLPFIDFTTSNFEESSNSPCANNSTQTRGI